VTHQGKATEFEWKKVSYMVFDAPTQNHLRYEERVDLLKRTIAAGT
jgi:hypothetical protein